ncbi:rhomboid family intramembrane serine protease [Crocinitomix catalasitica]|uniref:rhomboid family intramembrane serine protease n=1 Tax=Crocinitomix catalasitica TaxID=184607 RepID=UPI0005617996|nr:rhomboid family intramembrane serine protease [Crocinitomix catalasitica]
MEGERIIDFIKRSIRESGLTGKIIAVNAIVFMFFVLLRLIGYLFQFRGLEDTVKMYFVAPGNPAELLYKPWSLITQLFTHADFFHFFFNMFILYFVARIFIHFFGERRLLTTYLLGGIFAYLIHIIAYYIFPAYTMTSAPPITGASASIMAVFIASAIHQPSFKVNLFGAFPMPLILLAVLYVISDLVGIGSNDNVAHFAHLGGALFGGLSVLNIHSKSNFMNRFDKWFYSYNWSKISLKRKPKMKVYSQSKKTAKEMTDEEFNASKVEKQKRVDAILDKIAKKGYDGLNKAEKDFLFNESKRK